ncbi:electron transfer flavoprotein subunit alpha [Paenibacillus darwinianus]|uniref:Electron transfer flavoprotein subunit alpha n=1 Tax=Paenibacillus darwinianus TaxID=1380763 RepID=A0A9W5W7S9_9BACL|nr:electron transfer flavoprotein subunit alpha/FixB family protein [Paenibacillus darwinianus]EXX89504.1 electron transfer flavoprotein subunit alpha [Paenibacillus darwinianus]EXX90715.1 electron transfer flavoprotein subunit alpha [Paenibacillus darwinianus]EXX90925.1 electron transfer flavoprotein subunit alpha [Paenibacillus darwinianus]
MSETYLVFAEHRGGKLRQVTLEALQAAAVAADDGGVRIAAVLIGHNAGALAEALAGYPVSDIHVIEDASLEHYNPEAYLHALAELCGAVRPVAVFLGHTALGRDLAPALAARLKAGQLSDVIAVERSGDETVFTRPLYAGKAFEKKVFRGTPWIVTVRPNNIPPAAVGGLATANVAKHDYTAPSSLRTIVKDVVRQTSGKVDLTEAKIVVSGGRGVKSSDGFKPLEELAELLGGAVGASRGACDAGYCDYALQIGQTGKVVTPEIYIACGISGAIQHLAGMSQSRIIIAINKDPEAPIFKVADYGIVGDLFEVVPLLTEEFRKALA